MNIKHLVLFLLLIMCFSEAHAQWDAQISQYWRVKNYYNPSFAGEADSLEVMGLYRAQWMGVENAPKTLIGTAHMPVNFLRHKHGVGVQFMNESIGLFSNTTVGAQYAYKKKIKKGNLNIGVQLSMSSITFDASKIYIPSDSNNDDDGSGGTTGDDAIPTSGEASSAFDINLGISWVTPQYYVGLSTTHVLEPSFDIGETHSAFIGRGYFLTAGYNIKLRNPLFELQPSFLLKATKSVYQVDVTGRVVYNKMFNGGISWRKDDGFVFLLGLNIKGFDIGYAYDLNTSAISAVSKGSHEFFVRYNLPLNLGKTEKNRHKNVRVL
ncbi:type IX secretion system PorP/SprF family membrane protein [Dysgonomonas sp. PH5-45]|uniref:PorP/SprF family type IX secretion system membrane protein n=1 Tax=unclassified Dysgonomonas TaxID=2630389 RepID=UPI002474A108|nr:MULTISPECIES: type IX secretion system membrane protein PorP/SprF [unclassified Dysgonomonas]MDH6353822.1 type IX secretion system PorP/SprF family membrane protein [Dysgonomonas sp. PH5-45]MDH6386724.1 type IX secretion system PorP/SprF family membrane protein [Dysgonomonas sp. PH5-37]